LLIPYGIDIPELVITIDLNYKLMPQLIIFYSILFLFNILYSQPAQIYLAYFISLAVARWKGPHGQPLFCSATVGIAFSIDYFANIC
jgi:hypothetical protein